MLWWYSVRNGGAVRVSVCAMAKPCASGDDGEGARARRREGEADGVRARGDEGEAARDRKLDREAAIVREGDAEVVRAREGNSEVAVVSARLVKRHAKC